MQMSVHDHLTGGGAVGEVQIEGVPVEFAPERHSDPGADPEHPAGGLLRNRRARLVVLLRNHQDVSRIDRADVQKCVNQFILVDFHRRDLSGDDLTENTFRHFHFSLKSSNMDFSLPNTVS